VGFLNRRSQVRILPGVLVSSSMSPARRMHDQATTITFHGTRFVIMARTVSSVVGMMLRMPSSLRQRQ
ncbi:MAG: hypothetical protein ABIF19_01840, partial [Planctomycetota bacterium]